MNTTIRNMYLSGDSKGATELRDKLFKREHPEKHEEILRDVRHLLEKSIFLELIAELESIAETESFRTETEWRIKSVPSISDSINSGDSKESTIRNLKDLVGFRYWIDCETFDEFPSRMLSLIESLISESSFLNELESFRMIEMDDHPHQKVSIYFRVQDVNVEVQVKNLLLKSAYSRTLYPMWQGHVKNRFDHGDIPFCFDKERRTELWNIVCIARLNNMIQLPFNSENCGCSSKCTLRNQGKLIDSENVKDSIKVISNRIGRDVIFA